jgi:hypothetical protein
MTSAEQGPGSNCLRVALQLQRVQARAGVIKHGITGEFPDHAMPEVLPQPCSALGCTALAGVINGEIVPSEEQCGLVQSLIEKHAQEDQGDSWEDS